MIKDKLIYSSDIKNIATSADLRHLKRLFPRWNFHLATSAFHCWSCETRDPEKQKELFDLEWENGSWFPICRECFEKIASRPTLGQFTGKVRYTKYA